MIGLDLSSPAVRARPPLCRVAAVEPARVPSPPRLAADADAEVETPRLLRQYALACNAVLGLRSNGVLASRPTRWKKWRQVELAVYGLRDRGTPPAAYFATTLATWRDFMRRREAPPFTWCMSSMVDRHAPRADELAQSMGGAAIVTPSYAALAALQARAGRGVPPSPLELRRLVAAASYEADRERARLELAAREGWPW